MASSIPNHHHHHYSSDYFFSTELCTLPICTEQAMLPSLNYDINSPVTTSFPGDHQFGMLVPQMSDIVTGFRDFSVSDYQQHQVFEPGEDYCTGLMLPNFSQTNYNSMPPQENWGIQGKAVTKVEETEVKVGRYSVEERKDRILRYLKKRNHRNFNKTIKYACRKTLADKRVRVRGRFAKNNEPSEDHEVVMMNNGHDAYEQNNSFYKDSFQLKYEEDYWLQAAIDNLVHLPYLTS